MPPWPISCHAAWDVPGPAALKLNPPPRESLVKPIEFDAAGSAWEQSQAARMAVLDCRHRLWRTSLAIFKVLDMVNEAICVEL
jgi:hypothetical protein